MKRTIPALISAAVSLVLILAVAPGNAVQKILPLPAELSAYRSWKPLIKTPFEVPYELWIQCVAPSRQDLESARTAHGPHAQRVIQVYANRDAERTAKNKNASPFPAGSILAKEKLTKTTGGDTEFSGVAFMIKRSAGQFPETGGWEFLYFPAGGDSKTLQQSCGGCHKTAPRDYVFADYLNKKTQ
jgi:cytochrome P460